MFLVVSNPERRERRWYGPQLAGLVSVGSAREADIQIEGHNIGVRHVVLKFSVGRPWVAPRVRIDVKNAFGVRVDGRMPRPNDELGVLTIGSWELELHERVPRGIESVDAEFLRTLDADVDPDALSVYADSLEERGRVADADVVRGNRDPNVIARTLPEWRRSFLPVIVEGCPRKCERAWTSSTSSCDDCQQEVPLYGNIAAARERALAGRPVAVDPAVRRWPNDLKEAIVRQPAIVMGQPRR